jgi:hypothetical protein
MLAPMFRAVRRLTGLAGAVVAAAALAGCAGIGQPAPYDSPGINGLNIPTPSPAPDDFVAGVDNPWFPLDPATTRTYDVTESGRVVGSIEVEVLADTTEVAGLTATGVRATADIDGETTYATRYYAQDEAGNVWLVAVDDPDGLSWRAGEGGAEAGLAMPADPRLGDGWLAFHVPALPQASTTVEDQSRELVQTRDEGHDPLGGSDTTRNVYGAGVGPVSVENLDAGWRATLADPPEDE